MSTLEDRILAEWEQILEASSVVGAHGARVDALSLLEVAGVATILSSGYNGIENILKQAVQEDGCLPEGERWHVLLLDEAVRVGVIDQELAHVLRRWLAFRHFMHHGYPVQLDPARIGEIAQAAPSILESFRVCVNRFLQARGSGGEVLNRMAGPS